MTSSQTPHSGNPQALNRLLLVDGLNIVRRIYEAVPGEDSAEKAAGAIASSWGSIIRGIKESAPTHFLAAFDFGGPTWRHDLYPEYKVNRKPMPQVLRDALPSFHKRMNKAGLRTLSVPGVEADDTLATLAVKAVHRGFEVIILSTDKDMYRLIHEGVRIRDHFKSEDRDEAFVQGKFGIPSRLMGDLLALMGDSTDGIPGVDNVGLKTAAKLLNEHGSLDNVLDAACSIIDPIKGAIGLRLQADASIARLSRDLAALKLDVPLGVSPNDLLLPPSVAELIEAAKSKARTGKSFVSSVNGAVGPESPAAQMAPATEEQVSVIQDHAPRRMRA